MIKIAPSLLAADINDLSNEIQSVSSADYLHFDVMDGVFVPNTSFGLQALRDVRKITDMVLDVHLMIESPSKHVADFAKEGGDIITFHVEAEEPDSIHKTIQIIHEHGKKAGLSIKPNTPATALIPYIDTLDLVLVMTVEPGYGGQEFISAMLPKIVEVRSLIDNHKPDCELEVDGGINHKTAKLCIEAGVNVLVAGSDVFAAVDRATHISELRNP